jgi:predicted CXXCH cytochrome family protein
MKNHVWRPVIVVIGIVALILAARAVYVPKDFGVYDRGYIYSWHRKGDEDFWKNFKIKYQGKEYCKDCHDKNYVQISRSPHRSIMCENCHGPAVDHPSEAWPKLVIDKSREQCYRCHVSLPYPTSGRSRIRGFPDPEKHNPGIECVMCHNPHSPKLGGA